MHARKQLLAAGSTVTLVAGGLFFSAAPASAVHNSPECISAQSQFTAALHNAGLNADLEVELAVALQNLVDAQETLDLLDVEGALTLEELEVLAAEALVKVREEQLPNINAIINANAGAGSAVGEARALLEIVTDGEFDQATAEALLELGINVEDFLLAAALDIPAITAGVNAAVEAGIIDQAEADVLLDAVADGELDEATVAALLDIDIDISTDAFLLDPAVDRVALEAALELVIEDLILDAEAQVEALLTSGDLTVILAAEADLEALLGIDLDLSALVNLQTQALAAQAVVQAQADLDAAIAAVNGLRVQLDALDIDLLELEALFDAAIEACTGVGAIGGGYDDDDEDHDNAGGGAGGAVTTGGGAGGTGGTNRGMNVQTAVSTAGTDPAGIGALAAGIGFMVVAGTLAARRIRSN